MLSIVRFNGYYILVTPKPRYGSRPLEVISVKFFMPHPWVLGSRIPELAVAPANLKQVPGHGQGVPKGTHFASLPIVPIDWYLPDS